MSRRNRTYIDGVTLVTEECINCGVVFALPDFLREECIEHPNVKKFYCPNGHWMWYTGDSPKQQLAKAEARETALRDQLHAAEAEAENVRQRLMRDRHRFANGICPCCNRYFDNVRRHVQGEHPDYDPTELRLPEFKCSCGRRFASLQGLRTHQGRSRPDDWQTPRRYGDWSRHLTVTS